MENTENTGAGKRGRGRPKGSKNKPKEAAQKTARAARSARAVVVESPTDQPGQTSSPADPTDSTSGPDDAAIPGGSTPAPPLSDPSTETLPRVRASDDLSRSDQKRLLLFEMSQCGNVSVACERTGIKIGKYYRWCENSPTFAEAAKRTLAEALERELWKRGVEGEPVHVGWFKGKPGGVEYRKSDSSLQMLVKAHHPAFRDQVQLTGALAVFDPTKNPAAIANLTDEQLTRLLAGDFSALLPTQPAALPPGRDVSQP